MELLRQDVVKLFAHINDTVRHGSDILFPLLEEGLVVHDKSHLL